MMRSRWQRSISFPLGWGLALMSCALFLTLSCDQRSGGAVGSEPSDSRQANPPDLPPSHPPISEGQGGVITGTITVDPALAGKLAATDVVYIIARSAEQPGPPLAVKQVMNIHFPYAYTLSSADVMMPMAVFEGRVNIEVRLDRDGAAGPPQPGDMEGIFVRNPATVGDRQVNIVIDREF